MNKIMINAHNIVIRKHEGKRFQKCRIRWKDNTKMTVNKKRVWTGFTCLTIESSGWLLWTLQWPFLLQKNRKFLGYLS